MTTNFVSSTSSATGSGSAAISIASPGINAEGCLLLAVVVQTASAVIGDGVMSDNQDPTAAGWTAIGHASSGANRVTLWACNHGIGSSTVTITFTPDSGASASGMRLYCCESSVGNAPSTIFGAASVKQLATGSGSSGAAFSATLGTTPVKQNPIICVACQFTSDNISTWTGPSGYSAFGFDNLSNIACSAAIRSSGETNTAITWVTVATASWISFVAEVDFGETAAVVTPSGVAAYGYPDREHFSFDYNAGARTAQFRSPPMISIPAQKGTAITVPVFLRDSLTLKGWGGAASLVTVTMLKPGSSSFVAPSNTPTIVATGNGWFNLTFSSTELTTAGRCVLHVTGAAAPSGPAAIPSDEIVLNLVAYDQTDGVHLGLSALPNATAGASGGVPLVYNGSAGTQIPNAGPGATGGIPIVGIQIPLATAGANTGLPVVGTQIPNATAGANNGLPIQGGAVPNATAGANGGLPVQGGAIPNANADAVGGLPTITAIGQGPGGQVKANSMIDKYVYGTGTNATHPVSWRVRVFANKAACDAATPGNSNNTDSEVERYLGSAIFDGTTGLLTSYKYDKDL